MEHQHLSGNHSRYHLCEEEMEHQFDPGEYRTAHTNSTAPGFSSTPRPRSGYSVSEASSMIQAPTQLGTVMLTPNTGSTYELTEIGTVSGHSFMAQDSSTAGKKPAVPKTKADKHHWGWEIAALVLCLSTLAATIGLLVYGNGLPLTKWTFIISFNAIISILGAVTRASLGFAVGSFLGQWKWNLFQKHWDNLTVFENFEDASRGPWGSATLIFRFRIRYAHP